MVEESHQRTRHLPQGEGIVLGGSGIGGFAAGAFGCGFGEDGVVGRGGSPMAGAAGGFGDLGAPGHAVVLAGQ